MTAIEYNTINHGLNIINGAVGYTRGLLRTLIHRCYNCGTILQPDQLICHRCGMNQLTHKEEK